MPPFSAPFAEGAGHIQVNVMLLKVEACFKYRHYIVSYLKLRKLSLTAGMLSKFMVQIQKIKLLMYITKFGQSNCNLQI